MESMKLLNHETQGSPPNGTTLESSAIVLRSPLSWTCVHLSQEFLFARELAWLGQKVSLNQLAMGYGSCWVFLAEGTHLCAPRHGGEVVSWATTEGGMWFCSNEITVLNQ